MFMKNLLNSFIMPVSIVRSFLLITSLAGRLDPDLLVLPITSFLIFHVFLALFLHLSIFVNISFF